MNAATLLTEILIGGAARWYVSLLVAWQQQRTGCTGVIQMVAGDGRGIPRREVAVMECRSRGEEGLGNECLV